MKKWYKKTIISSLAIGVSLSIAIPLIISNLNKENSLVLESENNSLNNIGDKQNSSNKRDLTPSVSNFTNGKLVSKSGPIVFWGDTIMSLDWFGSVRWELDLTNPNNENFKQMVGNEKLHIFPKLGSTNDENTTTKYGSDVERSWVNWDLDKNNEILWILSNIRVPRNNNWDGNGNYDNQDWKRQWLVGINVKDGKFYAKAKTSRIQGNNDVYRNVSVLANGDPTSYGTSFSINNQWNNNFAFERFYISQKNQKTSVTMKIIKSDTTSDLFDERAQENSDVSDFMFNIIPLANNVNLVLSVEKSPMRKPDAGKTDNPWTSEQPNGASGFGNPDKRSMNIKATLVDDQLNILNSNTNDKWDKPRIIINNEDKRIRNKWIFPQRDWYKLLDGRIITIIYDHLIVIDGTSNSHNPKISIKKIPNVENQWIESWSFDTDEALYIKGHGDTKIQRITLDPNKNGTEHIVSGYYDMAKTSIDVVKNNASSMSIYNVPGYAGQVMAINSYQHEKYSEKLPDITTNNNKYGLSVAIIKNANQDIGDIRGLLNTDDAFQKSATFSVKDDALKNKLPSEITKDDLEITEGGFLTKNTDKDTSTGELLYKPLIKEEVDDIDGQKKLKITANIDQIPWFVQNGKMPSDIKPLTITQIYENKDFAVNIKDRFTWKPIENDYDFKNTLPSKLELSYVNRLDPLISSLESQKAIIGNTSYPNVSYSLTEKKDDEGKITINATYEYLPLEQKIVESNVKRYTISKTFDMFKSSDNPNFQFVGEQNITDISYIPELKELKESEILPSYFNTVDNKQEFLKFIDVDKTKGYPLEKININAKGNDLEGTLTISVDTSKYDNLILKNNFSKTFKGLNKTNSYKMLFKEPSTSEFDRTSLLPSNLSEELIYKHFLQYEGFNAKDFIMDLVPNDVNGELSVYLKLNNDFPESALEEGTDFKKQQDGSYLAFKKFSDFKTNEFFNKEYQIVFKDLSNLDVENDKKLIELMKLTPSYIQTKLAIGGGGIIIENETFTDVKSISKLFIESYGAKIPQEFNSSNIDVDMFINNSAGEITLKITFKKLDGYPNSISFVQSFSGFSKGNDISTDDILSFYDENLFFTMKPEYKKIKPSQMKETLKKDPSLIKYFFSVEPTGDYKKAIQDNKFTLSIIDDDNNGKFILTITFDKDQITNPQSLLEYTLEYNGFDHY